MDVERRRRDEADEEEKEEAVADDCCRRRRSCLQQLRAADCVAIDMLEGRYMVVQFEHEQNS